MATSLGRAPRAGQQVHGDVCRRFDVGFAEAIAVEITLGVKYVEANISSSQILEAV